MRAHIDNKAEKKRNDNKKDPTISNHLRDTPIKFFEPV